MAPRARRADPARTSQTARREGTVADVDATLPAREQALVLRAFALYFQLANLAEQLHRAAPPPRGRATRRIAAGVARRGLPTRRAPAIPDARARLVDPQLVLTAHPTEATRRTVLLAHIRIAELLDRLDDPRLRPAERAAVERADRRGGDDPLADRRGAPRAAARHRRDPPRALVLRAQPASTAATELLARLARARCPDAPPPLRFGSWIGGDMDGNPAAGPASIERGARPGARARARALPRGGARRSRSRSRRRARSSPSRTSSRRRSRATRRAARLRGRDRRAQRARAVPAEALLHVVAARQRRLPRARGACSPTCA